MSAFVAWPVRTRENRRRRDDTRNESLAPDYYGRRGTNVVGPLKRVSLAAGTRTLSRDARLFYVPASVVTHLATRVEREQIDGDRVHPLTRTRAFAFITAVSYLRARVRYRFIAIVRVCRWLETNSSRTRKVL